MINQSEFLRIQSIRFRACEEIMQYPVRFQFETICDRDQNSVLHVATVTVVNNKEDRGSDAVPW
jgi:hypothetical protein